MSLAARLNSSTYYLRSINKVRMYMNIIHLSDITSADGRLLNSDFNTNRGFPHIRNSYSWPKKHHITSVDLSRWRWFASSIFSVASCYLPSPLGNWLDNTSICLQSWDWFVSRNKEYLYHNLGSFWNRHPIKGNTHRSYFLSYSRSPSPPTVIIHPATISVTPTALRLQSFKPIPLDHNPPPSTISIGPFSFISGSQQCFFNNITHSDTLNSLYAHVFNGTAIACSDGSFYPLAHIGACGWVVSTPDMTEWIQGGCIVPGDLSIHSAYRAELGGLTAIALFFNTLITPTNDTISQNIFTDCKSAINKLFSSPQFARVKYSHMDLLSIISALWSSSSFNPTHIHVYGHQDSTSLHRLSVESQLNCRMDTLAKSIALAAITSNSLLPPPFISTLGFGSIICHSTPISSCLQQSLYHLISHSKYISYVSSIFRGKLSWEDI